MDYKFAKLSEVKIAEEVTGGAHVLGEQDGEVCRIPKSKIGAQADWNETDETNPAFILNKPEIGGGGVKDFYFVSNGSYRGYVTGTDATGEQVGGQDIYNAAEEGNVIRLRGYGYGGPTLVLSYFISGTYLYLYRTTNTTIGYEMLAL